ncbi:MAG: SprT-like domain-containing protein [Proteobacteria bacterium]|nr:SprT-like domain-containing protein [Pseudomonadota bacterium]
MMETLTKLNQEIMRTLTIARTRFPNHSFPEPEIKMNLTGKNAGMYCNKPTSLLRFNLILLLDNKEDFLQETVPHEVAHFIVNVIDPCSKPHGFTWREIMRLFGVANPKTYHNYKVPAPIRNKRPYVYQCSCQKHFFTKQKHNYAKSGTIYICNTCHNILHYVGKEGLDDTTNT